MVPGKLIHGKLIPGKLVPEIWSPEKCPSKIVIPQKNTRKGYSQISIWKLLPAEICLNVYQMVACDQKLVYAKLQPPKSHFTDVRENKEFFMTYARF